MGFFDQNVAIVTGGSSGIGYGIAEGLAKQGAKVYILARDEKKLADAKQRIVDQGGSVEYRSVDVTKKGDIETIIDDIYTKEKRLDIFINNAGKYEATSLDTAAKTYDDIMETDFHSPKRVVDYLVSKFKSRPEHIQIVTTASHAAYRIFPGGEGYGSAKAALSTAILHKDLELKHAGVKNILLYVVYPKAIATPDVIDKYRRGEFGPPIPISAVTDLVIDMLRNTTPTPYAQIGFDDGVGIRRLFFRPNIDSRPEDTSLLTLSKQQIVDASFDPVKAYIGK